MIIEDEYDMEEKFWYIFNRILLNPNMMQPGYRDFSQHMKASRIERFLIT
jgi:hypothetical protein